MTIQWGISAINWVNEDILSLGDHYTAEQVLADMSSLGFQATENCRKFPQEATALKSLLSSYNMSLSSQWNAVNFSDPSRREQSMKEFKRRIDFLHEMGCKHAVTCESGNRFEDLESDQVQVIPLTDEQWQLLVDGLHEAGEYCTSKGIKLVYHYHGETVIETPEAIDRLMASTNPELVHLLYDTGHARYGGYDPYELLCKYYDRIAYIHMKDIREEPLQELIDRKLRFREGVQLGVFTVPGDGCINFEPIVQELLQRNYSGWIIIEAEQDPDAANPVAYAKQALKYLQLLGIYQPLAHNE